LKAKEIENEVEREVEYVDKLPLMSRKTSRQLFIVLVAVLVIFAIILFLYFDGAFRGACCG